MCIDAYSRARTRFRQACELFRNV